MELDVDFDALRELRGKVGQEREIETKAVVLPPPYIRSDIHRQLALGIQVYDLSNLEHNQDGVLLYRGIPVTVHRWNYTQFAVSKLRYEDVVDKVYHMLWCSTLQSLHKSGRLDGQLMLSHRESASLSVEAKSSRKSTSKTNIPFPVCRKCLGMAGAIRWWYLPARRKRIATDFDLAPFFQQAIKNVVDESLSRGQAYREQVKTQTAQAEAAAAPEPPAEEPAEAEAKAAEVAAAPEPPAEEPVKEEAPPAEAEAKAEAVAAPEKPVEEEAKAEVAAAEPPAKEEADAPPAEKPAEAEPKAEVAAAAEEEPKAAEVEPKAKVAAADDAPPAKEPADAKPAAKKPATGKKSAAAAKAKGKKGSKDQTS